jgi:integrase
MVPSQIVAGKQHPYSIQVTTSGGSETGSMDSTNISDVDFKVAIETAIARDRLFKAVLQGVGADYALTVRIVSLSKPLFGTQKRKGFTANTLCQHFHYLYKQAGIEGASSHSGRRTFITTLANKGVGVRVLMELAGHRSIAVTQKYIDVNPGMLRKAVELI